MRAGMRRLLVVLVVAGAGFVPAPATAAGYCSGSGVSVVVDFGALGGGVAKDCDGSGNRNAAKAFENTGHHLTRLQSQQAFVCRVDGLPTAEKEACVVTPPSDAYWGLYWSDGTSGWKYSSLAVDSLNVPAGATVAFSWQNGGTADPPGTAPAAPPAAQSSAPAPTAAATRTPTKPRPSATAKAPAAGQVSASASAPASATPSASASASGTPSASTSAPPTPSASTSVTPFASASTEVASGTTTAELDDASGSGDGLPWWLPVGSIVALAGAGGVVWQVRRARP